VFSVKKKLVALLLISMLTLSFAVPAMAVEAVAVEPVNSTVEYQEISPFFEQTEIFWRTYRGHLQMRVWSVTRGRWLTDWISA